MHKFSYPYLGQLKFSSGAFILLVGVTRLRVKLTCGKFNWMGMIWKGTHVLIKGPTADNAYQSKNQALGSKELPVELRNRFVSSHTSGEEFRKKFCFIEGSQKYVVIVTFNWKMSETTRILLRAGLLAKLSNWWRRALVSVVTKNLMVTLVELLCVEIGEIYRRTNTTATLHQSVLYGSVERLNPLLREDTQKHTWNLQKST